MGIIDEFRKQPIILQILDIVCIIVLIYELLTMRSLTISWILLFLIVVIPLCQGFFKKED